MVRKESKEYIEIITGNNREIVEITLITMTIEESREEKKKRERQP